MIAAELHAVRDLNIEEVDRVSGGAIMLLIPLALLLAGCAHSEERRPDHSSQ